MKLKTCATIAKVTNGYVVTCPEGTFVFDENSSAGSDFDALISALKSKQRVLDQREFVEAFKARAKEEGIQ